MLERVEHLMLPVRPKQTVSMQTRDGVRLDADVYCPDADGPFPVLLMRQPYGRAIASTVVYAHPRWYAAQGYIVVIQDVRGRGTSEGEFTLFAHEVEDGFETVNWAASLPGSTGEVGMYGFSYQGMTQLYAAVKQPPALKTLCPSMIGFDLYHDWAYEGGAFCYQLNLGWAMQLAAETKRRQGDANCYRTLYGAARNLPLHDPVCAQSGLLKTLAPDSFYHDWLNQPNAEADYWQRLSPCYYTHEVDLPMLHIGGWFDTYLRGTLRCYNAWAERSQHRQQLVIGPWTHLPWGRKVGAVDFGAAAATPIDRLQIRWFDQFLKGIDTGILNEPPVQLFEMGGDRWRLFEQFPDQPPQPYWLHSTGLACMSDREGTLSTAPASLQQDIWVHDPWRPVPSLGGHAAFPAGSFDRSSIDCRSDVVTYTTEPLTADLHLAGCVTAELHCSADAISFDLCAVLSEVKPNGAVMNVTQGYCRVAPEAAQSLPIALTLQPTCVRVPSGSALRLSVSAACFPAYAVNSGTGDRSHQAKLIDAQVITLTLTCGGDQGSKLCLPVVAP